MKHKCDGCAYKCKFLPVCVREFEFIEAIKAYQAEVCPYTDKPNEKGGEAK